MQSPGATDLILRAYPTMSAAIAQHAEDIRLTYCGLERALRTLANKIDTRSANHVPVSTDDMQTWLTRSHTIRQRQHRANEAIDELARGFNETTTTDSTATFLREWFQPVVDRFVAAAQAFSAAVTTATAAQRD